jgi:radial spoke head protein 1
VFTKEDGSVGKSNREFTGRGTANYPNGDSYSGEYVNGARRGKGRYTYANGDVYEGDFENNLKHGIGQLAYKDKGEYSGQWENGRKHGEGSYTYANGDVYSGWWMFGKKHGIGTYIWKDTGMRAVGTWEENRIVKGRWILPNGTYWEGAFKNNKPEGRGVWHFKNGNVLEGAFSQTVIPNEDPEDQRVNLNIEWQSTFDLYGAASQVNLHEAF